MESAIELGYDWKPIPKYFDQDRLQGSPMGSYGVPTYEARWNARMWVEEAVSLGATLLTGATARRVLIEDGVATGVEFDHRRRTRRAFGSKIVVAAGGIGSPVLLRASGLQDAGRSFFCDPVVLVIGSHPGAGGGQELPMTAGVLLEDEGYTLTDVSLPRWMLSIVTAEVGRIDKLVSSGRAAAIMVEIRDDLDGRITPRGGIRKPLSTADRQKLARGTERARGSSPMPARGGCFEAGCWPPNLEAPYRSGGSLIAICGPRLRTSSSVMLPSSPSRGACRRRSRSSGWGSGSRRIWPPARAGPTGTEDHRPAPRRRERSGSGYRAEGAGVRRR